MLHVPTVSRYAIKPTLKILRQRPAHWKLDHDQNLVLTKGFAGTTVDDTHL